MLVTGQARRSRGVGRKADGCVDKKQTVSRKARARLADAPAPPLMGLPRLPIGIPRELINPVNSKGSAKIALALLDSGLLTEEDMQNGNHPASLIESLFKRWFERVASPLTVFDLHLNMSDSIDSCLDSNCLNDSGEELLEQFGADPISFGVSYGQYSRVYLKEKVEAIEKVAPGLGRTAMQKLESVLCSSMFAVTPCFVEDAARYQYWGGCEDDEEFIKESMDGCDEEEIEAMREEMITSADVKALMPNLESKEVSDDELFSLVNSSDLQVASVAKLLLELDNGEGFEPPTHIDRLGDEVVCVEPGVWIQWQQGHLTERILDDWYQGVMEYANCCDTSVLWLCELDSEKIVASMNNIERFISRLAWAEKMLALIGEREIA